MAEQVLKLIFPPAQLNSPTISNLIRTYDSLQINILQGDISSTSGWLVIQFVGNPGQIESATTWLQEKGIAVQVSGF
jgi:ABC-type methionine transport system ATPase subunit